MKLNKKRIKRILIMRLGKIGDVLLSTPLIRNLKKNFPKAHIAYIVSRRAAPVLENNPNISKIIISDRDIFYKIIKQEKYDLAIDLNVIDITSQLSRVCGARYRAGLYKGGASNTHYNILLGDPAKKDDIVNYVLRLLKKLGLKNDKDKKTEIYLTSKEKKFAQRIIKRSSKKLIGIQATFCQKLLWPVRNFARLADILISKYGTRVVIFSSPYTEAQTLKFKKYMKQKACFLQVSDLRKYLAVLSRCDMFIANEGGQIHMAMALGVPTIGIFGSEFNKFWSYYKDNFKKIVSRNINTITPGQVINEIEKINVLV